VEPSTEEERGGEDRLPQRARSTPLRFQVGTRVECHWDTCPQNWLSGTIEQLWIREDDWPEGTIAPYLVALDVVFGESFFVMLDDAACIRLLREGDPLHRFPILSQAGRSRYRGDARMEWLRPGHIDGIGEEANEVFRRCSGPESALLNEVERRLCGGLMFSICLVGIVLEEGCATSESRGALVRLFWNTLATRANLEALLRMCDAGVCTGSVRCYAIVLLGELTRQLSVWKIKMDDRRPLSSRLVGVYAKCLHDETKMRTSLLHNFANSEDPECPILRRPITLLMLC